MKFKKNLVSLPIPNFDTLVGQEKKTYHHGDLLADSIRAVFCRPSNCNKTNSLLALIVHINGLRFEHVYLYSKFLNQPKNKFLKELLDGIKYFPFSDHEEVVSPNKALPNSLMIFDDIACEKQDDVRAFFINVDSSYLGQTYSKIPK